MEQPEWAREEAFPAALAGHGWVDRKGRTHACPSFDALAAAVGGAGGHKVLLVWTPDWPRMKVPEEVAGLHVPLHTARLAGAEIDRADAAKQLWFLGAVVAFFAVRALARGGWGALLSNGATGMVLLLWVMFGVIPWYRAWKTVRETRNGKPERIAGEVEEARFDAWLARQRSPLTWMLCGLLAIVGLAQLLPGEAWLAAGLVKERYLAGEWWRLLTAPLLHGHPVHWFMNASALVYLGRRTEVLARWPHLAMVFLFAALVGGECSARLVAAPSVGASGGLMGLLGFLLAFETLHRRLVPVSARRRLLAGLVLTAVIGVLGFRFIDNAAHAGGLVAGLFYGAVVFPKSAKAGRPRVTGVDIAGGLVAVALLWCATCLALWRMFV